MYYIMHCISSQKYKLALCVHFVFTHLHFGWNRYRSHSLMQTFFIIYNSNITFSTTRTLSKSSVCKLQLVSPMANVTLIILELIE